MPKKVLIVYATGGMGHVSAARSIEKAFKEKHPEIEVKNVDVIDFASGLYKLFFVHGYNYVSAKMPNLWGWLYQKFNNQKRQWLPSMISQLCVGRRFISFIKEFKPDFIISTHPLPMVLVSYSKERNIIDIYSSMVVTDYGCHSFWVDPEVNYYFAATEFVSMCLQNYQVAKDKVVVTGIPIDPKFSQEFDREALLEKYGLHSGIMTMLIVGGQFDFLALEKIIKGIQDKNKEKVQFLVVAGRDNELKEALDNSQLGLNSHVKVFGFIDYLQELMAVSDVIFSKAGGLTVSECLANGLPMIINKVIPGQEEDNVNYLLGKGAAIKVDDFDQIITEVDKLLNQPELVEKMKLAAKQIGKPNSAYDLAEFVVEKIK